MRLIVGALALAFDGRLSRRRSSAQQPSSVNPTASAVKEQQLLQQLKTSGPRHHPGHQVLRASSIRPAATGAQFHNVTLRWIGGIAILGMLALLVIFYLVRGMVKIESGRSGRTIVRFNAFERFVHWMTATCFIILAHHRAQHHVRPAAAAAADRPGGVHHLVGMGEIRPQLSQLPVHARRGR